MRRFHYKRNPDFCPSINVDRLWSMVPEGVYEKAKADSSMAPVIDVTKLVSNNTIHNTMNKDVRKSNNKLIFLISWRYLQGYFKVLGKGNLPSIPLVVKAKFFSKDVSRLFLMTGTYLFHAVAVINNFYIRLSVLSGREEDQSCRRCSPPNCINSIIVSVI